MTYRIAACNWMLRPTQSWDQFSSHLAEVVGHASGCDLLVLPECMILELAGPSPISPPAELAAHLAERAERYELLLLGLAAEHQITIVGGSHFQNDKTGILNVAAVASADGSLTRHPKHKLTQYEVREWGLRAGHGLVRCRDQNLGVLVCYDCEFPEAGRLLAEAGVTVLTAPAYTETRRGFQRVRWSCMARAIENQTVVVHSSLVGSLGGEPVPQAVGSSAILVPSVEPFPESAILAETGWNEEGLAVAEIDLADLALSRNQGDVRNWHDRANDWELR